MWNLVLSHLFHLIHTFLYDVSLIELGSLHAGRIIILYFYNIRT